jgi:histidinol-phosphate phosphatase family protein
MANRAVFIDRDGTLNEHTTDYVKSWGEFKFLPNTLDALKKLTTSDFKIIVITNQGAVGRGRMSLEMLEEIHMRMLAEVEAVGGRIDGLFVCTHLAEDKCGCRKPNIGLLKVAAASFDLDLKKSWFVGDNTMDIKTGKNAGCKTILVGTGYGGKDGLYNVKPDRTAKDLLEAVDNLLG